VDIARVVESTPGDELFAMAIGVLSIPQVPTDALLVFPGMGEDWRIRHAILEWRNPYRTARFLMIAPVNSGEETYKSFDPGEWKILDGRRGLLLGVDSRTENTKTQAVWVCKMIREHDIRSISLFVSPYHLVRAYLTLLKQMLLENIRIPIISRPTPVSPSEIIPESKASAWQSIPGEAERIRKYQENGDVATLAELEYYLAWLWNKPILVRVRLP